MRTPAGIPGQFQDTRLRYASIQAVRKLGCSSCRGDSGKGGGENPDRTPETGVPLLYSEAAWIVFLIEILRYFPGSFFGIRSYFVFPEPQNTPTSSFQFRIYLCIAQDVAFDLVHPEFGSCFRPHEVRGAFVPETAIYKYGKSFPYEYQIWLSCELIMQSVPPHARPKSVSYTHLRAH